MREVDELLRRRPDLGTLVGRGRRRFRARLSEERGPGVPGVSALTAAELRLLPMLATPPVVPGDRRGVVPVPLHRQVGGDVDLPEAEGLLAGTGGRPVPRAGAPARVTTGISSHRGDRARPGLRWNDAQRRVEVHGSDGAVPGDFAQAGDDRRGLRRRRCRARSWPGRGIGPGSQDRGVAPGRRVRWPSGHRLSAWSGARAGRWRRARRRTRSPTCCWRSSRWPGSAGSSRPLPIWLTALEYDISAALE